MKFLGIFYVRNTMAKILIIQSDIRFYMIFSFGTTNIDKHKRNDIM